MFPSGQILGQEPARPLYQPNRLLPLEWCGEHDPGFPCAFSSFSNDMESEYNTPTEIDPERNLPTWQLVGFNCPVPKHNQSLIELQRLRRLNSSAC